MNSTLVKIIVLLLMQFIFTSVVYAQNISGSWKWVDSPEDRTFDVTISKPNPKDGKLASYDFIGKHCGLYYNGGRIDCAEQVSIFLKKERDNIFTGAIKSAYSEEIFEIRIVYTPKTDQINWQVIKGQGQFYFPRDAILEK
ncbi:hypothetical protein SYJ56_01830 [Algoriphagus sp. D3-2-R+10]|uniref:hypothetical protein n=1 Tax=Algoriphagus aurantiacus TaxID=3103948 RepID=UPI002B36661F|nr:hypothetical protein [Algoriphagus sp. D3-2-R+10]MEB2774025.1 hypothetical protein [Algoriphagus sp. D3-2-R+10]